MFERLKFVMYFNKSPSVNTTTSNLFASSKTESSESKKSNKSSRIAALFLWYQTYVL